jgi:hypothetical protein
VIDVRQRILPRPLPSIGLETQRSSSYGKPSAVNNTNAKGKNLIDRLANFRCTCRKIPFLDSGYWVGDSKVSAGATAEYLLGVVFNSGSSRTNPSFTVQRPEGEKGA